MDAGLLLDCCSAWWHSVWWHSALLSCRGRQLRTVLQTRTANCSANHVCKLFCTHFCKLICNHFCNPSSSHSIPRAGDLTLPLTIHPVPLPPNPSRSARITHHPSHAQHQITTPLNPSPTRPRPRKCKTLPHPHFIPRRPIASPPPSPSARLLRSLREPRRLGLQCDTAPHWRPAHAGVAILGPLRHPGAAFAACTVAASA